MGQQAEQRDVSSEESTPGGGRILVVDDDALLRSSVGRMLADEGYSVDVAGDGYEALARVADSPPDLILLDVLMPGMNGRELLETLRGNAATRAIPVLVMTAVQGIDATAGITAGSVDYVEKPFDIDELLNKVALALYRASGAREGASLRSGAAHLEAREGADIVLLVDDDRRVLESLDRLLSGLGYTVVSMSRVTEELPRLARVLEPRAILLDLHMPGTDGMTALRRLRAEAALDRVPILVFSGSPAQLEACRAEIEALSAESALKPEAIDRICELVGAPPPHRLPS
jgi:DNA-binding response OmpR family regulator